MNASTRLTLRIAIPVISLAALALAGEPAPVFNEPALAEVSTSSLVIACEDGAAIEVDADAAEQRSRTAMRLRWAVTLPDSSRPLSIRLLP